MIQIELSVGLTVVGPVLTGSTSPGAMGVDAPAARAKDGRLMIPFSLVKGRLRQSWDELLDLPGSHLKISVEQWLGPPPPCPADPCATQVAPVATVRAGDWTPHRGRLRVTRDFVETGRLGSRKTAMTRVRIDPVRGAAADGALQVLDAPVRSGEAMTFQGTLAYEAASPGEAADVAAAIAAGLAWVPNLGAERSVGFGRVASVRIAPSPAQIRATVSVPATCTTKPLSGPWLSLVLTPHAPFCLSRRQRDGNVFESEDFISGGAVRGCIVSMLNAVLGRSDLAAEISANDSPLYAELRRHLNSVRFLHAFPSVPDTTTGRARVVPQSIVKSRAHGERLLDVALVEGPLLIRDPREQDSPDRFSAPEFQIDWKNAADAQRYFGWISPAREVRVRTAMDWRHRRARDQQLFSYEMVRPDGCEWRGAVDLSRLAPAEYAGVISDLQRLLSGGLHFLGKTKTSATIALDQMRTPQPRSLHNGASVVLDLQSMALLTAPDRAGAVGMFLAYQEVWDQLSGGSLVLQRSFARQSLQGGYLVHRYLMQTGKQSHYYPFLLTDAGATFVLMVKDAQAAQTCLEEWAIHGLPLPQWAVARYGDSWKTCPFRREDGFGEIVVDDPVHRMKAPAAEEVKHVSTL